MLGPGGGELSPAAPEGNADEQHGDEARRQAEDETLGAREGGHGAGGGSDRLELEGRVAVDACPDPGPVPEVPDAARGSDATGPAEEPQGEPFEPVGGAEPAVQRDAQPADEPGERAGRQRDGGRQEPARRGDGRRAVTDHTRRRGGDEDERDEQAEEQGRAQRDAHRLQEDAHALPAHEDQGQEDHHGRHGREGHGEAHVADAEDGRVAWTAAESALAGDALDDHDRVVHQHPDAQGQPRHRQHVERPAGEALVGDGQQRRDRDAEGHAQGHARAAQEQEQHEHGESAALEGRALEPLEAALDEVRLVEEDLRAQLAAEARVVREAVHDALELAADLDDVRRALLLDHAVVGVAPVDARDLVADRVHALDGAEVADAQAVLPHRIVADLVEVREAHVGAQDVLRPALLDLAQGLGEVVGAQALDQRAQVEPRGLHLLLVEEDPDRLVEQAPDADAADAVHRLELLLDVLVDERRHVVGALVRHDREPHDRHVAVVARPDPDAVDRVGELRPRALDPVAQLRLREVGVRLPAVLHPQTDAVVAGVGADLLDVLDRVELLLEDPRDLVDVLLRARPGVGDDDREARALDPAGQELEDPRVGDRPEQDQGHEEHAHRDGPAHGEAEEAGLDGALSERALRVESCCIVESALADIRRRSAAGRGSGSL